MAKYKHFFGVQAGQKLEAQPQGFDCFTRWVSKTCARSTTAGQRFSHLMHIWSLALLLRITFSAHSSRTSAWQETFTMSLWIARRLTGDGGTMGQGKEIGPLIRSPSHLPDTLLPEAVNLRRRAPLSDVEIAAKRARWETSNLRRKKLRKGSLLLVKMTAKKME